MKKYLLTPKKEFFKANLHSHSNYSDGRLTPQEMKEAYKKRGYSVIAYSDHNILIPHPELADETFLPLNAVEVDVTEQNKKFVLAKACHLTMIALDPETKILPCYNRKEYLFGNAGDHRSEVCFDESQPDYIRTYSPEGVNDMIEKFKEGGFFVTYNHPTWSLEDYTNYSAYNGMDAMEICNYVCCSDGFYEYNERVYDDMLRAGKRIYCIAADDNHNGGEEHTYGFGAFGGFVMINAEKLEYKTITKALCDGNFYASSGPQIHELYVENDRVYIKFSPSVRVTMTTGSRHAEVKYADPGLTITSADFPIKDTDGYIRLKVVDSAGLPAFTNAYFLDDLKK